VLFFRFVWAPLEGGSKERRWNLGSSSVGLVFGERERDVELGLFVFSFIISGVSVVHPHMLTKVCTFNEEERRKTTKSDALAFSPRPPFTQGWSFDKDFPNATGDTLGLGVEHVRDIYFQVSFGCTAHSREEEKKKRVRNPDLLLFLFPFIPPFPRVSRSSPTTTLASPSPSSTIKS